MTDTQEQYTKEQRKQIAEDLRLCKQYLWDGVSDRGIDVNGYALRVNDICHAIARAAKFTYPYADFMRRTYLTRRMIMGRLDGWLSFWGWLRAQGVPNKDLTTEAVQAHRHAWVDRLIKEFSD